MPTTYAVGGASRGIGLEFVRQLSGRADSVVFAIVRNKEGSALLSSFAAGAENVRVLEGDVSDHASLLRAAREVGRVTGGTLDVLIHNAARMEKEFLYRGLDDYATMDELDADFVEAFKVNTLGIVHSVDAFLPLLRAGATKKVVAIGTLGASYAFTRKVQLADLAAYNVTKAAGTMATVKYAALLAPEGFVVVSLSPGHVGTDATTATEADSERVRGGVRELQRASPAQTAEESVRAQLRVVDGLTEADNGKFLAQTGEEFLD